MPTTGFLNGNNLRVYVNGTAVADASSHDLEVSQAMRDVTTKDSSAWKEVLPGLREWGVSGDGLTALDAAYGVEDLIDLIRNASSVALRFTTNTSGDVYWHGTAYADSVSQSSPANETPTYSFSFVGTSALAKATLT